MQSEEDGEYEDHEGENMYVDVEDPYITNKQYKCDNCNKKKVEKQGVLFAPFCCNRQMKLLHRLEHKFDFESVTKHSIEKENKLFPNTKIKESKTKSKSTKKAKVKAKAKQNKPKPKKSTKTSAKKKRRK